MDSFMPFKERLDDEHNWPTIYMFKFVVPVAKADEVRQLFIKENLQSKNSKAGNYVAFTLKKLIKSSDEVIVTYLKANKVKGLIAM